MLTCACPSQNFVCHAAKGCVCRQGFTGVNCDVPTVVQLVQEAEIESKFEIIPLSTFAEVTLFFFIFLQQLVVPVLHGDLFWRFYLLVLLLPLYSIIAVVFQISKLRSNMFSISLILTAPIPIDIILIILCMDSKVQMHDCLTIYDRKWIIWIALIQSMEMIPMQAVEVSSCSI